MNVENTPKYRAHAYAEEEPASPCETGCRRIGKPMNLSVRGGAQDPNVKNVVRRTEKND